MVYWQCTHTCTQHHLTRTRHHVCLFLVKRTQSRISFAALHACAGMGGSATHALGGVDARTLGAGCAATQEYSTLHNTYTAAKGEAGISTRAIVRHGTHGRASAHTGPRRSPFQVAAACDRSVWWSARWECQNGGFWNECFILVQQCKHSREELRRRSPACTPSRSAWCARRGTCPNASAPAPRVQIVRCMGSNFTVFDWKRERQSRLAYGGIPHAQNMGAHA